MTRTRELAPLADRGPLRVMFVTCSLRVGGAETLLLRLIQNLNRERFTPELCCLKAPGSLAEEAEKVATVHSGIWRSKWDPTILFRLSRLFQERRIDAVVTVGAGDKMFWGRLAARRAGVPVVASALHSTGWPDEIQWLNRQLNSITDAFIGVAQPHGQYLIEQERLPKDKVVVIPNGVDIRRFRFHPESRAKIRSELGISADAPVCGVVAAQRPEKNLHLFLETASRVLRQRSDCHFLLVGDGSERASLEQQAERLGIRERVHFLGARSDVPEILSAMDLFGLTSKNEANPVSILEAMCCGLPVVSTDVGSVRETIQDGYSGAVIPSGDVEAMTKAWLEILSDRRRAKQMGRVGREHVVQNWSLQKMVDGYEALIAETYESKTTARPPIRTPQEAFQPETGTPAPLDVAAEEKELIESAG